MNVEAVLEGSVNEGVVCGIAAVVGGRDGNLAEVAAGTLGPGDARPVELDTTFRIASMTKAMTSVAALQLVERGELRLDWAVSEVLPEFAELQVLEGWDGDRPRLRPPAQPVTLTHLLTHTSGHGYWFNSEEIQRFYAATGAPDPLSGRRASIVTPLLHDPGERWTYGVRSDWLGQLVEKVSGRSLEEQLRAEVWEPLGMADTTFYPSEAQRSRMMELVERTKDGGLTRSDLADPEPDFASGGGGGHSTPRDYSRFQRMLLRGGELDTARILAPETVQLMFRDYLNGAPLPEVTKSSDQRLTLDVPGLPFKQGWGLGLHLLLEDIPGMRQAGSGDWAGLFNCYFWIDRTSGVTGLLMTQLLPFFDPRMVQTLLSFEAALYARLGATA